MRRAGPCTSRRCARTTGRCSRTCATTAARGSEPAASARLQGPAMPARNRRCAAACGVSLRRLSRALRAAPTVPRRARDRVRHRRTAGARPRLLHAHGVRVSSARGRCAEQFGKWRSLRRVGRTARRAADAGRGVRERVRAAAHQSQASGVRDSGGAGSGAVHRAADAGGGRAGAGCRAARAGGRVGGCAGEPRDAACGRRCVMRTRSGRRTWRSSGRRSWRRAR